MNRIGFKMSHSAQEVSNNVQYVEESIQQVGFAKAIEVLRDYLDPYVMPLQQQKEREATFFEKLRKVKERYFDPI